MKDDFKDVFHLRLPSQGCIFQKKSGGHGPLAYNYVDTSLA